MPIRKIRKFLDDNGVKYVIISHSPSYTAQEIATSSHIPGKELAKTVIFRKDGKMTMAILTAPDKIDFSKLKKHLSATSVELAMEDEFKYLFPDCAVGAMPPFGNLYDMDVFVDESLTQNEEIAFNAGTHTELIKLTYADFSRLVKPIVLDFKLFY